MTDQSLSLARLRADVAEILQLAPATLADDANLLDSGLDSLRAMNLAMHWDEQGVPLDFTDLAEAATLGELWARLQEREAGGAA